jgi:hypothetical protein
LIVILSSWKCMQWKLWYLALDDLESSFNQKFTKRSVTQLQFAILLYCSSVLNMKIKRGNKAVLLFFLYYLCITLLLWWKWNTKCGSKAGQEVNILNVSVLEGNSITFKSILFLLEMKIENQEYIGCKCTFWPILYTTICLSHMTFFEHV